MSARSLSEKDRRELTRIVGDDAITCQEVDRVHYTHDSMSRTMIQSRRGKALYWPEAVLWPQNTEQVAAIVQWANRHKSPVIAFGGGSGVCGGTLPVQGGLMIDLKRMNRLESVQGRKQLAVAEAGINCLSLEEQLQEKGYTFGHFPSSIMVATLGGSIAARGAGQLSSKYGTIDDMIDAVEVVLPNGNIVPLGTKYLSAVKGLATVPLFIGSEGTLGIVTRCRIRLHRKAEAQRFRGISFVHLPQALKAIRLIMQSGLRPSVIRLYDPMDSVLLQWGYERNLSGNMLGMVGKWVSTVTRPIQEPLFAQLSRVIKPLKREAKQQVISHPRIVDFVSKRLPLSSVLILGFEGDPDLIASEEAEALKLCKEVLSRDEGTEIGEHWFKHRYSVSYKLPEFFEQGNFVDTIEVAATWDRLEDLYERVHRSISRHCFVLAHFSHAYTEGCSIYFTFVGREATVQNELRVYDRVWRDAMEACLQAGGTVTHHHGVGVLKARYMNRELGGLMDLFREIKTSMDPQGIMNPGKMGL